MSRPWKPAAGGEGDVDQADEDGHLDEWADDADMTGRAAEVRAMTKRRGESIPPPPRDTAAPMGEGQTVDAPPPPNPAAGEGNPSAVTYIQPHPAGATQPNGSALANRSSRPEAPTLDRLFFCSNPDSRTC